MSFVLVKREKKLADVVERVYGTLRPPEARRATAELMRANPHLARPDALEPGTMIVIPAVPGVRPAAASDSESPTAEVIGHIRDTLTVYRKRFGAAVDAERSAMSAMTDLLTSREIK